MTNNEIVDRYLDWAPFSLTIREISRINYLNILDKKHQIKSAKKILDIGCGDGKWWTYFMPEGLDRVQGIDISKDEIDVAKKYINAVCLDVTSQDFCGFVANQKFDLIIGNCSLEHVPELNLALINILNSLEENGHFILMVPTPTWALKGKSVKFLEKISPRLSMGFSGLLNGFFQHWHLYSDNTWRLILGNIGFKVEAIYGLGNSRSEFLFRLGLPTSFFSFLVKSVFGKYLNSYLGFLIPKSIKRILNNQICKTLDFELRDSKHVDIFEYMIVCKK